MEQLSTPPPSRQPSKTLWIIAGLFAMMALVAMALSGRSRLQTDLISSEGSPIGLSTDRTMYPADPGATVPVSITVHGVDETHPLLGFRMALEGVPPGIVIQDSDIVPSGNVTIGQRRVERNGDRVVLLLADMRVTTPMTLFSLRLRIPPDGLPTTGALIRVVSDAADVSNSIFRSQIATFDDNGGYVSRPLRNGVWFRLGTAVATTTPSCAGLDYSCQGDGDCCSGKCGGAGVSRRCIADVLSSPTPICAPLDFSCGRDDDCCSRICSVIERDGSGAPTIRRCVSSTPTPTASPTSPHIIDFGGNLGNAYTPAVVAVVAGDSVQWRGDFSLHPLKSDNNLWSEVKSGASFTHTFSTVGTYRFFCTRHGGPGGVGMSGMVVVLPKPTPTSVVCATDVKLCPDGRYVSRNPADNCNFYPCPNPTPTSTPSCLGNGVFCNPYSPCCSGVCGLAPGGTSPVCLNISTPTPPPYTPMPTGPTPTPLCLPDGIFCSGSQIPCCSGMCVAASGSQISGSVCVSVPPATPNPTVCAATKGDINCDGKVNIADLARLADSLAGKTTIIGQQVLNANVVDVPPADVGRVRLNDLVKLAEFIAVRIPSL